LSSLILFQRYLESGRRSRLLWSVLLFNGALYLYEVSVPLVVVFGILASGGISLRSRLSGVRKALPHLVSTACALAIIGLVRFLRGHSSPAIAATAVFALAFRHLAKRAGASARAGVLILIGAATWLLPACLIALSQKYQQELRWGEGYLPVYVQYFGVILVALGVLMRWRGGAAFSPSGRRWRTVTCALLASCLLVNTCDNRLVVEQANIELHYRRSALVEALSRGILAPVREGATLVIADRYSYNPRPGVASPLRGWSRAFPWKSAALVLQSSGRRLRVLEEEAATSALRAEDEPRNTFLLEIRSYPDHLKEKTGYVVLSEVVRIAADTPGKVRFALRRRLSTSRPGP
jgi:hypothetical protein